MRLHLEVFGETHLDRELLRFEGRLVDAAPVFAALADDFERAETRQFDSQGGAFSGGWARLKPSTIARKARRGLDPRILHATHALRLSLTQAHAPGAVRRITPDTLEVGSTVPYGRFHQFGTRHMPRRRPVEFDESMRREWMKKLQRFMVSGEVSA